MTPASRALVVSVGKNSAWIVLDGEIEPRLAALRRMTGKRSMPVPGDRALVRLLEDGTTVVELLEPRDFALTRRTAGGRSKTLAANVDTLVTVTALADPAPRLTILDQLLAFAALEGVEAIVVFTKPDLADAATRAQIEGLYAGLGYTIVTLDPKHGANVEGFVAAVDGRRALLCGISGVGKSSIFKALGGAGPVGEISRFGMGRQTTTTARLLRLGEGFLIDSPGVNEFGLGKIEPAELAQAFLEIGPLTAKCRFSDCSHLREPDCAVRAALAAGTISASRYDSYRRILLEPT
jgi:ribosome biogenesis GTPase